MSTISGEVHLLISNKEVIDWPLKDLAGTGNQKTIPFGIYFLMNMGTNEMPEFKELKPAKGKFLDDTVL